VGRNSVSYILAVQAQRKTRKSLSGLCRIIGVSEYVYYLANAFQPYRMQFNFSTQGEVENKLLSYAKDHESRFESYIMRPGMVLSKEMTIRSLVFGLGPSVKVDALAKVMIDLALHGNELQVLENNNICEHESQ
jgi:hypothetical protein